MDVQHIILYCGIGLILVLAILFEFMDGQLKENNQQSIGYEYYTIGGIAVRIKHVVGSRYRIYLPGNLSIPTKADNNGNYVNIRARTASEVEFQVDRLFETEKEKVRYNYE